MVPETHRHCWSRPISRESGLDEQLDKAERTHGSAGRRTRNPAAHARPNPQLQCQMDRSASYRRIKSDRAELVGLLRDNSASLCTTRLRSFMATPWIRRHGLGFCAQLLPDGVRSSPPSCTQQPDRGCLTPAATFALPNFAGSVSTTYLSSS